MTNDLVQRVALFGAVVQHEYVLRQELYTRGGGHIKDLEQARTCETLLVLLCNLVPELLESLDG